MSGTSNPNRSIVNNLPIQPTAFIGRGREVAQVVERLHRPEVRLFVLTGPGGIGKTRLGLEVAANVIDRFADGISFVSLESITKADMVIGRIARHFGIQDGGQKPVSKLLKNYINGKQILLFLDNFEHVMEAAPSIADLLATEATLKILVTSREILRLQGEHDFPVPPLSLYVRHAATGSNPDPAKLLRESDAVRLFVDRATAAQPDFDLNRENAAVIADICQRLDGLPLALELAAARVGLLPAQKILERLDNSLAFLTRGARDRPFRQQTLRATISWSHDLLQETEKKLFRGLSVFSGGFTLEAAEGVCAQGDECDPSILDEIASLKEKSLLTREESEGEPRFAMLETIREYAYERLADSGELAEVKGKHAEYFYGSIMEGVCTMAFGKLAKEHDNIRSALEFYFEEGPKDFGIEMTAALEEYWSAGRFVEGRYWTDRAMSAGSAASPALAKVIRDAGRYACELGDKTRGMALFEKSLAASRELGDTLGVISVLRRIGAWSFFFGDGEIAKTSLEEGLALSRETGRVPQSGFTLNFLAKVVAGDGDLERAGNLIEEGIACLQKDPDSTWVSVLRMSSGSIAMLQGDIARAIALSEQSLTTFRQIDVRVWIAMALEQLGNLYLKQGDLNRSKVSLYEAIPLFGEMASKWGTGEGYEGICHCFILCADIARRESRFERAVQPIGAAASAKEPVDLWMEPWRQLSDHILDNSRAQLGEKKSATAWEDGKSMSLDKALGYAVEISESVDPPNRIRGTADSGAAGLIPDGLSKREVEVAVLLVEGLTNREIGERLYISERTVANHVQSVLNKTGSGNRAEAAAYVIRNGLTH